MTALNSLSWFKKYQPTTVEEYVFENQEQKDQVLEWMKTGIIPGNVLLYGNAGTGKSALAHLLIRSIVKSQYDVEKVKDKSVAKIDELHNWCQKQPLSSKQKIIYIEEMDRASSAAFNSLKDGLMENYQPHVAIVATTNFLNRIEYAVQTRFNFRFNLNCSNLAGVYDRLSTILTAENVQFEMMDLKKFIEDNSTIGLRNMINLLQISCKDNAIDFSTMKSVKSEQEEQLVTLVLNIFKKLQETNNVNERILALNNPLNSSIAPLYSAILELINYNYDINYSTVFLELYDRSSFLPILVVVDRYLHSMETKRFQHIHFISFLYESIKCWLEMGS